MQPELSVVEAEIAGGPGSPFSPAISARNRNTVAMVENAIDRRQIALAFQPVVSARDTGQVAFYEGLIRVFNRAGHVIPAAEFIDAVEDTETGRALDCLSLEAGLAALVSNPGLRLSVNMSARSVGYGRWMQTLEAGLKDAPEAAGRLILEITESSALMMPEQIISFMSDLRRRGIAFALDDFGAGYTAFRYLRQFPFDIIKIDGQFIQGIADTPDNQVLAKALLSIARHFGMLTVAEAVERQEDAEMLIGLGVDRLQGYYFGPPSLNLQELAGKAVRA